MQIVDIALLKSFFCEKERRVASFAGMTADVFRYDTGIEAIRISNNRGHLVVLPYYGQMIWDAVFDGVDLTMANIFPMPRPASDIAGTYGCFAFHSGLLANGTPTPEDTHPLHGEMPCAALQKAGLSFGEDAQGPWMAITGEYEYAMGFGAHYLAKPRVILRPDNTLFDIGIGVTNLSAAPMSLMYMCHVNFAFCEGAKIIQPTSYSSTDTVVRQAIPGHVVPTPELLEFIDQLANSPDAMEVLDEPERYDPEQVFYIRNLKTDTKGLTHLMMRRKEGDAFAISYDTKAFSHTVRWVLANSDQKVAAFALPSTCEPEGYVREKKKGNVRTLAGHQTASFNVNLGYLTSEEAENKERFIHGL
ncbi:aldose 1-epimerase family protein [Microvirga sp. W0021]|uniref:Aldose 1-epimerase family protein n=1 Tax=Hohaiivirga grylli TaxID=3133970 RepID=A0ABV0BFX5_9HYPH